MGSILLLQFCVRGRIGSASERNDPEHETRRGAGAGGDKAIGREEKTKSDRGNGDECEIVGKSALEGYANKSGNMKRAVEAE